jgi:hypothetical protein
MEQESIQKKNRRKNKRQKIRRRDKFFEIEVGEEKY